jgi:hypothetical protein
MFHPPLRVFEGVVQPSLGACLQALHEVVQLAALRVWQLHEGLPIQGVWDGLGVGARCPAASNCSMESKLAHIRAHAVDTTHELLAVRQ